MINDPLQNPNANNPLDRSFFSDGLESNASQHDAALPDLRLRQHPGRHLARVDAISVTIETAASQVTKRKPPSLDSCRAVLDDVITRLGSGEQRTGDQCESEAAAAFLLLTKSWGDETSGSPALSADELLDEVSARLAFCGEAALHSIEINQALPIGDSDELASFIAPPRESDSASLAFHLTALEARLFDDSLRRASAVSVAIRAGKPLERLAELLAHLGIREHAELLGITDLPQIEDRLDPVALELVWGFSAVFKKRLQQLHRQYASESATSTLPSPEDILAIQLSSLRPPGEPAISRAVEDALRQAR